MELCKSPDYSSLQIGNRRREREIQARPLPAITFWVDETDEMGWLVRGVRGAAIPAELRAH